MSNRRNFFTNGAKTVAAAGTALVVPATQVGQRASSLTPHMHKVQQVVRDAQAGVQGASDWFGRLQHMYWHVSKHTSFRPYHGTADVTIDLLRPGTLELVKRVRFPVFF